MLKKMTSMSKGILFFDWSYKEEEVHEISPSVANKKRKAHVVLEIPKKPK
jgi:hypothetical protein